MSDTSFFLKKKKRKKKDNRYLILTLAVVSATHRFYKGLIGQRWIIIRDFRCSMVGGRSARIRDECSQVP